MNVSIPLDLPTSQSNFATVSFISVPLFINMIKRFNKRVAFISCATHAGGGVPVHVR